MRRTIVALGVGMAVLVAATAAQAQPIQIAKVSPYKQDAGIATNIIEKCVDLGPKLSAYTQEYGKGAGLEFSPQDSVDPKAGGRVLVVEITGAISGGNAFIGHRKTVTARAELLVDGQSKGSRVFTRDSGGGAFGGYKGSCSVLGRCVKTLGKDIAGWVKDLK